MMQAGVKSGDEQTVEIWANYTVSHSVFLIIASFQNHAVGWKSCEIRLLWSLYNFRCDKFIWIIKKNEKKKACCVGLGARYPQDLLLRSHNFFFVCSCFVLFFVFLGPYLQHVLIILLNVMLLELTFDNKILIRKVEDRRERRPVMGHVPYGGGRAESWEGWMECDLRMKRKKPEMCVKESQLLQVLPSAVPKVQLLFS